MLSVANNLSLFPEEEVIVGCENMPSRHNLTFW